MTLRDVRGGGVFQRRPHRCGQARRPLGREQDGGAARRNEKHDKRMVSDVHGDHLSAFLRDPGTRVVRRSQRTVCARFQDSPLVS